MTVEGGRLGCQYRAQAGKRPFWRCGGLHRGMVERRWGATAAPEARRLSRRVERPRLAARA